MDIEINLKQKEIERYLRESDIFFMPSLSETGPRVTLEAMKYGLPIIGTREGLGEYCNKKGGLLIKEKDIDEWEDKINYLISNPEKRKRMGECNFQRINKDFVKKNQLNKERKEAEGDLEGLSEKIEDINVDSFKLSEIEAALERTKTDIEELNENFKKKLEKKLGDKLGDDMFKDLFK